MKRFFIFGALPAGDMTERPCGDDFVIAADGGLEHLLKEGIRPDLIIGDFDSLGRIPQGENVIALPVMKDDTDTGRAAEYALGHGADIIYIYGCIGGLHDHTVANIQLCAGISRKKVPVYFFGDGYTVTAVTDGEICIPARENGRLSVFAFGAEAHGVSIHGAQYELDGAELSPFYPLGVSNSFTGREVVATVENGTLVIMYETA